MKKMWMAAIAVGALVAVLGVGAVWAQSTGDDTAGTTFLDRVAQKLGIDSPKLKQAIDDTRGEDIDAAVASGDLTQKQADELKQRASEAPGFGERGLGGPHLPGMKGARGFAFGLEFGGPGFAFGFKFGLPEQEQQLADFLGIPVEQLRTELEADDATLATVAGAHAKSRDDLKSFITSNLKSKLDKAVTDQDLTQKRADEMLSHLNESLDEVVDSPFHGRLREHFKFRLDAPGNLEVMPGEPAVPQSGTERSAGTF